MVPPAEEEMIMSYGKSMRSMGDTPACPAGTSPVIGPTGVTTCVASAAGPSPFSQIFSAIFGPPNPAAYPPGYVPPAPGMDSSTLLLLGAGAIALFMIMRKK